jgi:hypothetical protein
LPPTLASDDLTGEKEVVDLTVDDKNEPESEVIDVDADEDVSDDDRPRKRIKSGTEQEVRMQDPQIEEQDRQEMDVRELLEREEEPAALVRNLRAQEDAAMVPGMILTGKMLEAYSMGSPVVLKLWLEDSMLPASLRTGIGQRWEGAASRWYTCVHAST